jgi:hypothetical protein
MTQRTKSPRKEISIPLNDTMDFDHAANYSQLIRANIRALRGDISTPFREYYSIDDLPENNLTNIVKLNRMGFITTDGLLGQQIEVDDYDTTINRKSFIRGFLPSALNTYFMDFVRRSPLFNEEPNLFEPCNGSPLRCFCLNDESDDECVRLTCGHQYHRTCILEWFKTREVCPLCRTSPTVPYYMYNIWEIRPRSAQLILGNIPDDITIWEEHDLPFESFFDGISKPVKYFRKYNMIEQFLYSQTVVVDIVGSVYNTGNAEKVMLEFFKSLNPRIVELSIKAIDDFAFRTLFSDKFSVYTPNIKSVFSRLW